MRLPKLRELKEAITAVISPRFTTRFPAEPCVVPDGFRGKPEFDDETCIGCGACVNVCPTNALTMEDCPGEDPPVRKITQRVDACIFCGNCSDNCTTEDGINLSEQWDLATLDREDLKEVRDYDLQLCEKCGAIIGTKKHLAWLYETLGPLAYTNPSLLMGRGDRLATDKRDIPADRTSTADISTDDQMRILCPKCKCELCISL